MCAAEGDIYNASHNSFREWIIVIWYQIQTKKKYKHIAIIKVRKIEQLEQFIFLVKVGARCKGVMHAFHIIIMASYSDSL
jgi:hypothetical protein